VKGRTLELMRSLWALDRALQLRSKRMLTDIGVTGPQRVVVRLVGRQPGIVARDLALLLHVDKSTLASTLRRLEAAGLVRRRKDPRDRRREPLYLTPEGGRIDADSRGTAEAAVGRAMRRSSPRDLRAATAFIARLTEELRRGL
jgi:MarR family transcriptional regulator, organic hydroperoxide resistance regulator